MTREALRIGDNDLVGLVAEHGTQRVDFCRRTAAPGRRIRFVRHEHRLRRKLVTRQAVFLLDLRDKLFHHTRDVIDVETGAMKCAVCRHGSEQFRDRLQPASARGGLAFYNDGGRSHSGDHAVSPAVERGRRIFRVLVRSGSAGRQEAGADPFHQVLRRDVVGGHDDDALAAALANPVFCECHCLRATGARAVNLRIGAARTDLFGELGVAHRQDAEQELAVEVELRFADETLEL